MSNLTAKDVSAACDEMVRLQDKVAELERTVSAMDGVLSAEIDNYIVQTSCICYGGNSFPGPILEALKNYQQIMQTRIDEILCPTADIG